ncbi:MAG: bile acid:sodium symporter family protein [Ginsengibacter sp.]
MPSATNPVYNYFFIPAFIFLIAYLYFIFQIPNSWTGWLLALFFTCLAVAFRSRKQLQGFSYTVLILAAVSMAMYYPAYFVSAGDFKFSLLLIPLLQIIMFGMGTELSLKDFANVIRMPRGIILGIICHYTIMPFVGLAVSKLFNFPDEIAAGIILIGCCPSGLASNVMAYLARANLALSVSVTTISTLLAPLLTPLLMKLLASSYVEINFWAMVWDITKIVIIPIVAGLIFNHFLHGKFKWLDKAMPYFSMAGIAAVLIVITAAGRDSLLKVGFLLLLATLIHNLAGFFFGYWSARILKFPERDCRTIALEVGMQNAGLASGLALTMGKMATAGLAPVIFGTTMNVTGSSLASWWHHRVPKDELAENETDAAVIAQ